MGFGWLSKDDIIYVGNIGIFGEDVIVDEYREFVCFESIKDCVFFIFGCVFCDKFCVKFVEVEFVS